MLAGHSQRRHHEQTSDDDCEDGCASPLAVLHKQRQHQDARYWQHHVKHREHEAIQKCVTCTEQAEHDYDVEGRDCRQR